MLHGGTLATIINHPGVPWSAGGVVGGIFGYVAGQPDCSRMLIWPFECTPATLPLLGTPADLSFFVAGFTLIGAVVGAGLKKISA